MEEPVRPTKLWDPGGDREGDVKCGVCGVDGEEELMLEGEEEE